MNPNLPDQAPYTPLSAAEITQHRRLTAGLFMGLRANTFYGSFVQAQRQEGRSPGPILAKITDVSAAPLYSAIECYADGSEKTNGRTWDGGAGNLSRLYEVGEPGTSRVDDIVIPIMLPDADAWRVWAFMPKPSSGGARNTFHVVTASGNWTVPAGASDVMAILIGGGGGGSAGGVGQESTSQMSLIGGGGSEYVELYITTIAAGGYGGGGGGTLMGCLDVAPGDIMVCTIGAGGAGGSNSADYNSGSNGGTTTLQKSGVTGTIDAKGGIGGNTSLDLIQGGEFTKANRTWCPIENQIGFKGAPGGFGHQSAFGNISGNVMTHRGPAGGLGGLPYFSVDATSLPTVREVGRGGQGGKGWGVGGTRDAGDAGQNGAVVFFYRL